MTLWIVACQSPQSVEFSKQEYWSRLPSPPSQLRDQTQVSHCRQILYHSATTRYYLTPVRMAIIRKSTNNECWRGCRGKGTLLHCWWQGKLIQSLWKTVCSFLKKLGIKPPYAPGIPLPGVHPEETRIERDTCTPMFIAALFTIARTWKQLDAHQ